TAVVRLPNIMVVHPSVPAKSVPEFIAYAKANPGRINMAYSTSGGTDHLAGELFKIMVGVDMVGVPYRGGGAALFTDLIAGQVQVNFPAMASSIGYIRSDKLRPLADEGTACRTWWHSVWGLGHRLRRAHRRRHRARPDHSNMGSPILL